MKNSFKKFLTHVWEFEEKHDIGRYILSRVRLNNYDEEDEEEICPLGPISLCLYIIGIGSFIWSISFLSIVML